MTDIELQNYSTTDLLSILKGKENELSMLKETSDNATKNKNAQEGGLAFLNQQITDLVHDIGVIKSEIKMRTGEDKKPYVKPEVYISSNVSMYDLINKINNNCDDVLDDTCKVIPVKHRPSRYRLVKNNQFLVEFSNLDVDNSQICSLNEALAGDKVIYVEFFDYVYTTPQSENIAVEKVLLDALNGSVVTDITINALDDYGNVMKGEVFNKCQIRDIYTKSVYKYNDEEVRTISVVFTYDTLDIDVPEGNEADKQKR